MERRKQNVANHALRFLTTADLVRARHSVPAQVEKPKILSPFRANSSSTWTTINLGLTCPSDWWGRCTLRPLHSYVGDVTTQTEKSIVNTVT